MIRLFINVAIPIFKTEQNKRLFLIVFKTLFTVKFNANCNKLFYLPYLYLHFIYLPNTGNV